MNLKEFKKILYSLYIREKQKLGEAMSYIDKTHWLSSQFSIFCNGSFSQDIGKIMTDIIRIVEENTSPTNIRSTPFPPITNEPKEDDYQIPLFLIDKLETKYLLKTNVFKDRIDFVIVNRNASESTIQSDIYNDMVKKLFEDFLDYLSSYNITVKNFSMLINYMIVEKDNKIAEILKHIISTKLNANPFEIRAIKNQEVKNVPIKILMRVWNAIYNTESKKDVRNVGVMFEFTTKKEPQISREEIEDILNNYLLAFSSVKMLEQIGLNNG